MEDHSDLLSEINNPRQLDGLPHRRIFTNSQIDLAVYDNNGELIGFSISYNEGEIGINFAWMDRLFTDEEATDRGEFGPISNKRPVRRMDLARVFKQAAVELPEAVSRLIHMHLLNREFNEKEMEFRDCINEEEWAEIFRQTKALSRKYRGKELEAPILLQGEMHWLKVFGKDARYVLLSDAHHIAQQIWNDEQTRGYRY